MHTSITLQNYDHDALAQDIVEYIKRKNVKNITIKLIEVSANQLTEKTYSDEQFNELQSKLEECLEEDNLNFYLNIPEIKTTFEEFSYGVDANSDEDDFKDTFSKYT